MKNSAYKKIRCPHCKGKDKDVISAKVMPGEALVTQVSTVTFLFICKGCGKDFEVVHQRLKVDKNSEIFKYLDA